MSKRNNLKSDLTKAQYEAIGQVACEWAWLEETIQYFVWESLKVDHKVGLKITAEMQFGPLYKLATVLASDGHFEEIHQPPLFKWLKVLGDKLEPVRLERNDLVHRSWLRQNKNKKTIETLRIKKRTGVVQGAHLVRTTDEIKKVAQDIAQLHTKLVEILSDYEKGMLEPPPAEQKKYKGKSGKAAT
jgi:hypothetical protein